jgi:hypothetical protein
MERFDGTLLTLCPLQSFAASTWKLNETTFVAVFGQIVEPATFRCIVLSKLKIAHED